MSAHALLTSQRGLKESPVVTGPASTSGLREHDPKGGPLSTGFGGFPPWGNREGKQRLSDLWSLLRGIREVGFGNKREVEFILKIYIDVVIQTA